MNQQPLLLACNSHTFRVILQQRQGSLTAQLWVIGSVNSGEKVKTPQEEVSYNHDHLKSQFGLSMRRMRHQDSLQRKIHPSKFCSFRLYSVFGDERSWRPGIDLLLNGSESILEQEFTSPEASFHIGRHLHHRSNEKLITLLSCHNRPWGGKIYPKITLKSMFEHACLFLLCWSVHSSVPLPKYWVCVSWRHQR